MSSVLGWVSVQLYGFYNLYSNNAGLFSRIYCQENSITSEGVLKEMNQKYDLKLTQSDLSLNRPRSLEPSWLMLLWCIEFTELFKNDNANQNLKQRMIQDFLDTLYYQHGSFDELFYLTFATDYKKEVKKVNNNKCFRLTYSEICDLFAEILGYAFTTGLKYKNKAGIAERPIDYPNYFFAPCECARPIYCAMEWMDPIMVRLFLNLGVSVSDDDRCRTHSPHHAFCTALTTLSLEISFYHTHGGSNTKIKSITDCCTILLADTPYYSKIWLIVKSLLRLIDDDTTDGNLPSLKHICRFSLRSFLKSRNKVCTQQIWKTCKLPQHLISYMNIN